MAGIVFFLFVRYTKDSSLVYRLLRRYILIGEDIGMWRDEADLKRQEVQKDKRDLL